MDLGPIRRVAVVVKKEAFALWQVSLECDVLKERVGAGAMSLLYRALRSASGSYSPSLPSRLASTYLKDPAPVPVDVYGGGSVAGVDSPDTDAGMLAISFSSCILASFRKCLTRSTLSQALQSNELL